MKNGILSLDKYESIISSTKLYVVTGFLIQINKIHIN